jgi:hypothetical protein
MDFEWLVYLRRPVLASCREAMTERCSLLEELLYSLHSQNAQWNLSNHFLLQ